MSESDKRQMDRYGLNVPAFVSPRNKAESGTRTGVELKTKNISSGGAFLITDNPFQIDTAVDIDIRIAFFDAASEKVKESDVHVSGSVIRIDTAGMAVKFDKKFQIVSAG